MKKWGGTQYSTMMQIPSQMMERNQKKGKWDRRILDCILFPWKVSLGCKAGNSLNCWSEEFCTPSRTCLKIPAALALAGSSLEVRPLFYCCNGFQGATTEPFSLLCSLWQEIFQVHSFYFLNVF